jgi:hypothetical protein
LLPLLVCDIFGIFPYPPNAQPDLVFNRTSAHVYRSDNSNNGSYIFLTFTVSQALH